ncbi:hypothetical protein ACPWR0_17675 [Pandoraea pneumonica]|uniref:hypothetical protein n=1 Tax=Pandoraea pneumonica TaxID=2508299 RepID=UPI003CEF5488
MTDSLLHDNGDDRDDPLLALERMRNASKRLMFGQNITGSRPKAESYHINAKIEFACYLCWRTGGESKLLPKSCKT